ncbi:unnamed protein product [Rotaria sp. Silwood1]|nr:unnamed protein product [Rotaria sp. Silwood1]CAF1418387.1 unnamed protein product [Rotaria sp. Silwood1]CAF3609526.1 unnamed protein product [Rotaria sp. Silwood1]CAF4947786.1 unnamed protein product [Rotaria sp. Silwood1]
MGKIVLTGSTGALGSKVLRYLFEFGVNSKDIIISVYNPNGIDPNLEKIVFDVRHGDYKKKETLEKAFQGGEILFLISSITINNEKRTAEHRNAIDAAINVGIKHIYYTSSSIGDTRDVEIMRAHLNTEDLLKSSPIKYTIIREGFYSEVFPLFLGHFDAKTTNEIVIPADGGIPFVARDDLAEATAKILIEPTNIYQNKTILLTGSRLYTLKETALIVSKILDRQIPIKIVSLDEYINRNLKNQNEVWVRIWATIYLALQRGDLSQIDTTLEKILQRSPKSFEQTIKEMLTEKDTDDKETQINNKYIQASTFNNKT